MAILHRQRVPVLRAWANVNINHRTWVILEHPQDEWSAWAGLDLFQTVKEAENGSTTVIVHTTSDADNIKLAVAGLPPDYQQPGLASHTSQVAAVSDADLDLYLEPQPAPRPRYYEEIGRISFARQASADQVGDFIAAELRRFRAQIARSRKAWPICKHCGKEAELVASRSGTSFWGDSTETRAILQCPEKGE